MCLSSTIKQNSKIEQYLENGMPQKIVKTVEYTLKKRAAELRKAESSPLEQQNSTFQIPKMCGRFRKVQQEANKITNLNGTPPENVLATQKNVENSYTDILAYGTQLTRHWLQRLNVAIANLQQHKLYTILTKTTQPAHLVAVCILALVLLTVGPHIIDNRKSTLTKTTIATTTTTILSSSIENASNQVADTIIINTENLSRKIENNNNNNNPTLAMIAYLGAFATHFGAQIWMTFVSGLSLYFSLPRHTFGQCQQILFPKYFALNAILSITMLILFVKYFARIWTTATCIQLGALALSALIEVTIRLYLAPPMLLLMHEKYKIEGAIGSGQEVGNLVQGDLAQCPHYQRIHKMFRRIHMTIAIGNMIVLLATCLQLYFLAAKIQIS